MRRVALSQVEGVRWLPDNPSGVGALVVAGSSGRIDSQRAKVLARTGAVAESIRWFGGRDQREGPWDIPLEQFLDRVDDLRKECDRVLLMGTSFGSEAALLAGALSGDVEAVIAFAPSDVVWAGVRPDGSMTSHWTLAADPVPFVPFDEDWEPESDVPAYLTLYEASRLRYPDRLARAAIPVERIGRLVLVAGGDDQVWPSVAMSQAIEARRAAHGLETVLVTDAAAGHRAVLPGEQIVSGGIRMQRGGTVEADSRLGQAAWAQIRSLL